MEKIETLLTKNWFQYLLLGAITLLAGVMRFYKLGEWSYWIDEIFTINRAQIHFSDPLFVIRNLPTSLWLPVSVIFTAVSLAAAGVSEWSARLPAAVIGILSIPVLYFPVRKLAGTATALIFTLLLAISPWHLFWSQNARFYTGLMLFYTLAGFAFFYAFEQNRPKYLLAFYLLFYLAASERLIAIFLLPAVLIYLGLFLFRKGERPAGLTRKNLILFSLPLVILGLFDLIRLITSGSSLVLYALDTFAGNVIDDPLKIFTLIALNIGPALLVVGLLSGLFLLTQKSRFGLFLFINAVTPIVIVVLASPFLFIVDRYALVALPGVLILAAAGAVELLKRLKPANAILSLGLLALLVAPAASELLMYYQINHGNRPDWRQAYAYVSKKIGPNDILVSSVEEVGEYYSGREVTWLGEIRPDEVINGSQKYWFVVDSENGWWSPREFNWVMQNAQLQEMYYLRVRENIHIRIYSYEPRSIR